MRFLFAVPALILLSCSTALPADPAPPVPAPAQTPMVPIQAGSAPTALLGGPSHTDVRKLRVVVRWTVDNHGHVHDIRFPSTDDPRVDTLLRDKIPTVLSGPTTYAHVFLITVTPPPTPTAGPSPMIPITPAAVPDLSAPSAPPVTERSVPVFVGPGSAIGDISGIDFSSINYADISGKTYMVGWTVGEDGTVTDVGISPAPERAVGDLFIDYFLSMRFLPSVHHGRPQLTRMSHKFVFGP